MNARLAAEEQQKITYSRRILPHPTLPVISSILCLFRAYNIT